MTEEKEASPASEQPAMVPAWRAPAIALALAIVVLVVLLVPGVLRYQQAPEDVQLRALEDANRSLQDEIARLAQAEQTGVCMYEGDLYPTSVEERADVPDPDDRLDLLPPDPNRVVPQPQALPEDQADFAGNIDDLLRGSTVLVLNFEDEGLGSGTGFFVDRRHIATNAHVVGSAAEVIISNDLIQKPLRAQVVNRTALSEGDRMPRPDFALLRLDQDVADAIPLSLAVASRTQDVLASGYPGFFLKEQVVAYANAVISGQDAIPPQGIVTNGIVTTIQTLDRPAGALEVIPHTAQISPGNSGGPLVDACGRVVGINTFITQSSENNLVLHGDYALSSNNLADFLLANGVTPNRVSAPCPGRGIRPQQDGADTE